MYFEDRVSEYNLRKVFELLHPDLIETLAIDRVSPKINDREKIMGRYSLFCLTGGGNFT